MQRRTPPPVRPRFLAVLALSLSLAPGAASADKRKEAVVKGDNVDISPIANQLIFAHDGNGNYVAATKAGVNLYELYYGDGKTFYKQIVKGGGGDTARDSSSWAYFEPRVVASGLKRVKNVWTATCGKREVTFNTVSETERKKLLKKAKFKTFKFKRQPFELLRDRRGVYYFVDRQRFGGGDYRLFVGRRGNMKKYKLIDIVDDSEGKIFVTKKGDLHIVVDNEEKLTWSKESAKPKKLKRVPLYQNLVLIYTDLGPYENERVGTPCDGN